MLALWETIFSSSLTEDKNGNVYGKVRKDLCHLTGKNRGAAHNTCGNKAKQTKFVPVFILNLSGYDVQLFFKEIVKNENQRAKFASITNLSEIFISITIGCLKCFDPMRYLKGSLDSLSKNPKSSNLTKTRRKLGSLEFFARKLSYPYEYFKSIFDYYQLLKLLNKIYFNTLLSQTKVEGIQRTFEIIKDYKREDSEGLTLLYLKSDVCLLVGVFETFIKLSFVEYGNNPL